MANPLCHFEFTTNDPEKCQKFYGSVFNWEFDSQSMPGYTLVKTGSEACGGIMKRPPEVPAPCFTAYYHVDDIGATIAKAEQAGGKVLCPETPIPSVGSFAVLADPEGLHFGIFKGLPG